MMYATTTLGMSDALDSQSKKTTKIAGLRNNIHQSDLRAFRISIKRLMRVGGSSNLNQPLRKAFVIRLIRPRGGPHLINRIRVERFDDLAWHAQHH